MYQRETRIHDISFADLCHQYIERYAKLHKRSCDKDARRIRQYLLPLWADREVHSIARGEIAALHQELGVEHPYEANRLREQLSKMFELAKDWGYLDENAPNPAKRIKDFREHKRERWLRPDEIPRLAAAVRTEPSIYVRSAIWLLLLTGLRKRELLGLRWEDVYWAPPEIGIRDSKSGRPHHVPLGRAAIVILEGLPKQEGNAHIFPGRVPGKPINNLDKAWNRIRRSAGLLDVRIHDLRRTAGSWLAQDGCSLHLIGAVLNQSTQQVTATYARFDDETIRRALDRLGTAIVEHAIRDPEEIVREYKRRVFSGSRETPAMNQWAWRENHTR